ncbi:Ig-like domain-containing protein [Ectothiorhodospira lacustris]|uniref:Ig-like domain-containing protein n=1 Tax=Ectothiorhodospira lacustris TaxID=2899127 RepID=UPI001EE7BFD8|nr:Ig-like domain-containing protein [Ectothiorhodospira lacustris]MCG5508826.1 ice-binding family protein [Ectothiorhodospira lacustris]MCG5520617.1 ice-binding family protein [Ectothiorhodospira lacustris]
MAGMLGALTMTVIGGCDSRDTILGTDGNVTGAPTIIATSPEDGAISVPTDAVVTATFSEPMAPLTGSAGFVLSCDAPCANPTGDTTLDGAGTTASFTPAAALEVATLYTATITGASSQASGRALAEPVTWRFRTAGPPPTLTAVTPLANATGVATNTTAISAQFTQPVDALAAGDFTLTCESPCTDANGVVGMNGTGTIATFTVTDPAGLEPSVLYTGTIVSATSSSTGQPLPAPFVWSFTTGSTPDSTRPQVTLTVPETSDPGPTTEVPPNTAITATFSEDMDPATISDDGFTLTCEAPCVTPAPSGRVSYVVGSRTAVFTPDNPLEAETTYTATITGTATDLAGNPLSGNQGPIVDGSDYAWTFTTETAPAIAEPVIVQSTAPLNGGTIAVCPLAGISAVFDVPSGLRLDPASVNGLTFRVVEDAAPSNTVAAESVVVDVDTGTIVTFTPQALLTDGATYRATLTGGPDGVTDLAVPPNALLEDFAWTFTAVAPIGSCVEPAILRSAAPFGSFGGSAGITNQGLLTVINGDIGTTAVSTAVTGFVSEPDCTYTVTTLNQGQVNGRIFASPPPPTVACPQDGTVETQAIADQARLDAEAAFIALSPANLPGGQDPGNDNLGNLTLTPGVYTAQSGAFRIQGGDLTLDGQGNQNAVWIFQMATTLTVGGPGADFPQSVTLTNGAQAKNVYWQVGSAATINAAGGGTMKGTIIAADGVSFSTADNVDIVTLDGRAMSLGGSVTMVNTIINVPAP